MWHAGVNPRGQETYVRFTGVVCDHVSQCTPERHDGIPGDCSVNTRQKYDSSADGNYILDVGVPFRPCDLEGVIVCNR